MSFKIVITGGPGSGKSEVLNKLQNDPVFASFHFFSEMARMLLEEVPDYRSRWHEFHQEIYRRQIKRENEILPKSFITDRGTVDAFAFHSETAADVGTTIAAEYERYDLVFHLQSAAVLGKKYYINDAIRKETIDEALAIDEAIKQAWQEHPNYCFIEASFTFDEKYIELTQKLKSIIGVKF